MRNAPSLHCRKKGRETIQEDQSREKIFTLHILVYIVESDFIQEMQYFSVQPFYCWQNGGWWIVCSYLSEQMSRRSRRDLASICHFLYFKEKSVMGGLSPLIPGDEAQVFMFQCFVLRIVCLEEFKIFWLWSDFLILPTKNFLLPILVKLLQVIVYTKPRCMKQKKLRVLLVCIYFITSHL